MGKIIHGNRNFGYAPIVESNGTYSFGTPVMMTGLVSIDAEIEQESTNVYADDGVYCVVKGAKVRSLTANFRNILDTYAPYLGFVQNDNGMFTDTGSYASHCIFFTTTEEDYSTGTTALRLHYFYNVKGAEPTLESSTDEDEVEAQEISVEYSATESEFVVDDDGNYVQYGYIKRTDENATVFDTFASAVLLPTTVMSN